MTIYIITIILLLILSFAYDFRCSNRGKKTWGYIAIVFLILIAGFRDDIGNDTMVYHQWYKFLSNNPITALKESRFEPLFILCCVIAKNLGLSWLILQIIFATWINYSIFIFIRKYTNAIFLSLLLYFISIYYFLNCEEIRAAIAFCFVLIALSHIKQNNYLKFSILVIIGCGFHYSNALYLILPFIPNLFKNKLRLAIILLIIFLGANVLYAYFGVYSVLIDSVLGIETMSSYIDSDYLNGTGKSILNLINIFITSVLFPVLCYYISRQSDKSLDNIFFIYLFCIIGSMFLILFYRFNHQLSIVSIIVLCRAISTASISSKIIPKLIATMSILIFIYVSISVYINYNSYLDGYFYENFIPYKLYEF